MSSINGNRGEKDRILDWAKEHGPQRRWFYPSRAEDVGTYFTPMDDPQQDVLAYDIQTIPDLKTQLENLWQGNAWEKEISLICAVAAFKERHRHTSASSASPRGDHESSSISPGEGLEDYLSSLKSESVAAETVGAIVMNGNPFTKGHAYLVESASKQVDFLYVFVIEEDKSLFSFQDRFAMAQANCRGLPEVKVLPSGKYMISSLTFPAYFYKEHLQEETIVPVKDLRIFGAAIAPCLNITKRFVGEEPFDQVTYQYNETMKKILPDYGIDVVEVPRYACEGDVVSATKVRNLLKKGDFASCRKYLTDITWAYMEKKKYREGHKPVDHAEIPDYVYVF